MQQDFFSYLVHETSEAMFIVDTKTARVVDCNFTAHDRLGYTKKEFIGLMPHVFCQFAKKELSDPDVFYKFLLDIEKGPVTAFSTQVCKDGKRFPVRANFSIRKHKRHKFMVVFAFDISEEVKLQSEKDLLQIKEKQLSDRYRHSQSIASIGSWEWDIQAGTLWWSDELYKIFKVSPSSFIPTYDGYLSLIHPDDRKIVSAQVAKGLKDGSPFEHIVRTHSCEGEMKTIHGYGQVILDCNGVAVKMHGTGQDISAQSALKQSEDLLNKSQEYTKTGSWQWSPGTDIFTVSKNYHSLFGPSAKVNSLSEMLNFIHPDDKGKILDVIQGQQTILEYQPTINIEITFKIIRSDNKVRVLKSNNVLFYSKDKSLEKILGITTDVTELKMLRNELVEVKEQERYEKKLARQKQEVAEEKSRLMNEFLANMSHDLRTPLNSIVGFAQLLDNEDVGPLNELQRRYRDLIQSGGDSLLKMINQLLQMEKIENDQMPINQIRFNLLEFFNEYLDIFSVALAEKQLHLRFEIEESISFVVYDPLKLEQILNNLISNAIKFTQKNGNIAVGVSLNGAELVFSVQDDGVGIEKDRQIYVFEKFSRLNDPFKRSNSDTGTGLGLAITKLLVELQGGRIWLESEGIGKGAKFMFTMPVSLDSTIISFGDTSIRNHKECTHAGAS